MRKIDYQHLARAIREEIDTYRKIPGASAHTRVETAVRIARNFAARASVDRPTFLNACGIDNDEFMRAYNVEP
jgi:hypothetical protein